MKKLTDQLPLPEEILLNPEQAPDSFHMLTTTLGTLVVLLVFASWIVFAMADKLAPRKPARVRGPALFFSVLISGVYVDSVIWRYGQDMTVAGIKEAYAAAHWYGIWEAFTLMLAMINIIAIGFMVLLMLPRANHDNNAEARRS